MQRCKSARSAFSTAYASNRREHRDRSQQGSAIPRRQGRQRCPQSADSEGGSPEEVSTTKEIRDAKVDVLSMCGRAGTAASSLAISRGARLAISCLADAARCGHDRPADQHSACGRIDVGGAFERHCRIVGHDLCGPIGRAAARRVRAHAWGQPRDGSERASRKRWRRGPPAAKRLPIGNLINRIVG